MILSAAGVRRVPRAGRAGAAGLSVLAAFVSLPHVHHSWDALLPVYVFAALVLAVAAATRGRAAALTVVLFADGAGLPYDAVHHADLGTSYHVRVTPDQAAGARRLRAHSSPDEYVATIYEPTPDRLRWLWDQRVRWILVDRAQGRESPRLADQATYAWSAGDIVIYRLSVRCT
ncbi:hypothetical protein [Dactylosporangium sp. NPDC049140]|uniref:hypothetical protein n=1 Tax=Dactylosporangium sp. NPDC049140 TaxID=3155647 RepID=UPI0033E821C9